MIFLIASAVYIICGFLINILHFKLIVSEAFPNRAFWTYFIGLVQDGVAFSFMVITCRQRSKLNMTALDRLVKAKMSIRMRT